MVKSLKILGKRGFLCFYLFLALVLNPAFSTTYNPHPYPHQQQSHTLTPGSIHDVPTISTDHIHTLLQHYAPKERIPFLQGGTGHEGYKATIQKVGNQVKLRITDPNGKVVHKRAYPISNAGMKGMQKITDKFLGEDAWMNPATIGLHDPSFE